MIRTCLLLSLLLLAIDKSYAAPKDHESHSDCKTDSECVSITSLKQVCRHIDPKADSLCPAVNKKYQEYFESIECYQSVGCRAVGKISCKNENCVGEEVK